MIYFFKLLFLFGLIDQELILRLFGVKDELRIERINSLLSLPDSMIDEDILKYIEDYPYRDFDILDVLIPPYSTDVTIETFEIVYKDYLKRLETGLSLNEIESVLIFIIFLRFCILTLRYNLKTSFCITAIGMSAGFLWHKHLVETVLEYRGVLVYAPWFRTLALSGYNKVFEETFYKKVNWYNLGGLLKTAIIRGTTAYNEDDFQYVHIDPLALIISRLPTELQNEMTPLYYKFIDQGIPRLLNQAKKVWNEVSSLATYGLIVRVGKRYCPYFLRWHWTYLVISQLFEDACNKFMQRIFMYQQTVIAPELLINPIPEVEGTSSLIPEFAGGADFLDSEIWMEEVFIRLVLAYTCIAHFTYIMFGLLHAICGQYFYCPVIVENTELHIGLRPNHGIYSGGKTAWQDPIEKLNALAGPITLKTAIPKLWYGWFGRGTKYPLFNFNIIRLFKKLLKALRNI